MPDHRDKPASAMARGAAKCSDIERVRRDVEEADACSVRAEEASVARRRERVANRTTEQEAAAQTRVPLSDPSGER
jgi:hypothetical protein